MEEEEEGDAVEKAKPCASVEAILATSEEEEEEEVEEVVNRSLDETLPLRLTLLQSIRLAWLAPETVVMTRCCGSCGWGKAALLGEG